MGINGSLTTFFLASVVIIVSALFSYGTARAATLRENPPEKRTSSSLASTSPPLLEVVTPLEMFPYRWKRQVTFLSSSSSSASVGSGALRCKLYCQNGFYLQSHPDGIVNGTKDSSSKFAILEMLRVAVKLVSIRSAAGGNYICMNRKGKMYASRRRSAECVFVEEFLDTKTFVYSSRKFSRKRRQLFIALNRKGRGRRGKRRKQRSVQFYILPVEVERETPVSQHRNGQLVQQHLPEPPEDNASMASDNEPPDPTQDLTLETQENE